MYQIRLAQKEDSAAVLDFYETVIDHMTATREKPGWKRGVYPEEVYLNQAIDRQDLYLLMEEGKIWAAVILNHRFDVAYDKVSWLVDAAPEEIIAVHTLATHPDRLCTGLAGKLMDYAAELGRSRGCKSIRLDAWEPNEPAHCFYRSRGFTPLETLELYYVDTGLSNFVMYEKLI